MNAIETTLAENPWPVVFALLAVGSLFLVMLAITQNGRNLIRALILLGLAGGLLLIDHFWTTDREKLAAMVAQSASAVKRNDLEAMRLLLAPDAVYQQPGLPAGVKFSDPLGKTLLREALDQIKFDMLSVRSIEVNAGKRTGRGSADFKVLCSGTWNPPLGGSAINFPPTTSSWSFGFRREKNGDWKIDRITPVELPTPASGQPGIPGFLKKAG
ncbi:MAG: hypothetical protein ACKO5E_07605 [bacterium]